MNNTVKISLIVVGIIGTGIGLWFLLKPNTNKDKEKKKKKNNYTPSTPTIYINNEFPLKKGSGDIGQSIKRVEAMQKWLNTEGWAETLVVDGKFGNDTAKVWGWQQDPFANFKSMWPLAIEGQVDEQFYTQAINGDKKTMKDLE